MITPHRERRGERGKGGRKGWREGIFVSDGSYYMLGWSESLTLFLALFGKCAVSGSFCVIYLFTAELFPTEVRYNVIHCHTLTNLL